MKNVRAPTTEMYVFVRDYLAINPGQRVLVPFEIRTPEGEKQVEVVFKDFDAVVGNPPYTRWTEISDETQSSILRHLKSNISKYDLTPQVSRGVEPGIYVYWIMHSTGFLKDNGRLGMIISDSWLQTDYGKNFLKFLLDNYKVHAVTDISARVFPVPLIGTCILLLEKCLKKEDRDNNVAVFAYLDVSKGSIDVDEILKFVEEKQSAVKELASGARIVAKAYTQKELEGYEGKPVDLIFRAEDILDILRRRSPLVSKLSEYFEPARGNIGWSVWALKHSKRPDVGGNKFFYLTEKRAEQHKIPQDFLYPLLPSSRYLKFFTFAKSDWEELRDGDKECYLFLCHMPRNQLPESVRRYIELGEGSKAQIRLRRRPGEAEGGPVSESQASQTRRKHRNVFFDWYDLGGVVKAPIIASYYAQYWHRFALTLYNTACDADIIALIPLQGKTFNLNELKALLLYLNSSIAKLYLEANGRSTGGGALAIEANVLNDMPILDVRKLSVEEVERLAELFDKLESEARKLGGADTAENIFGSELAEELTGKRDVEANVSWII